MSRYVARMQDREPITLTGLFMPVAAPSCGPWHTFRPRNALQIRLAAFRSRLRGALPATPSHTTEEQPR